MLRHLFKDYLVTDSIGELIHYFYTVHNCFVAKTVLAGSGSGRKGGKAVKVQAVSRARSSRKTANSDVGEESSSASKFLYPW